MGKRHHKEEGSSVLEIYSYQESFQHKCEEKRCSFIKPYIREDKRELVKEVSRKYIGVIFELFRLYHILQLFQEYQVVIHY